MGGTGAVPGQTTATRTPRPTATPPAGPYTMLGFDSPIVMPPSVNPIAPNKEIYLYFQVRRGGPTGSLVSHPGVVASLTTTPGCVTTPDGAPKPSPGTTPAHVGLPSLSYNSSSKKFKIGWLSPATPNTAVYATVTLIDGTSLSACFLTGALPTPRPTATPRPIVTATRTVTATGVIATVTATSTVRTTADTTTTTVATDTTTTGTLTSTAATQTTTGATVSTTAATDTTTVATNTTTTGTTTTFTATDTETTGTSTATTTLTGDCDPAGGVLACSTVSTTAATDTTTVATNTTTTGTTTTWTSTQTVTTGTSFIDTATTTVSTDTTTSTSTAATITSTVATTTYCYTFSGGTAFAQTPCAQP
ncbi:MAG: hypothetical protein ACKOTZ_13320 [Chloroflexota bacterium]